MYARAPVEIGVLLNSVELLNSLSLWFVCKMNFPHRRVQHILVPGLDLDSQATSKISVLVDRGLTDKINDLFRALINAKVGFSYSVVIFRQLTVHLYVIASHVEVGSLIL